MTNLIMRYHPVIVKERCGTNFFDPNNEFCFNNIRIYDKCNGNVFDPTKQSCAGEAVKPKCGTGHYDLSTQFCYNNNVYPKCNGSDYNPAEHFCYEGATYSLCGGRVYNPSQQTCSVTNNNTATVVDIVKCGGVEYDSAASFCYNNMTYPKCGGRMYDPSRQSCNGTSLVDIVKCNGVEYDGAANFCYNNTVYPKCGGNTYDPLRQTCNGASLVDIVKCNGIVYDGAANFCYNNTVYPKCGGNVYDPSRQTCNGSNVVDILKCNGVEYDGAANFCYNNTVYAKCGGNTYDPSNKTCNGTNIVDIVKYTVYFNPNGGMDGSTPPTTMTVDSGTVITIPGQQTISRSGYSFGGWNTSPYGSGTYYGANDHYTVTGTVTIYVKWIPIRTITFDGNGSTSGDPPEPVLADSGTVIRLPGNRTLVKTGCSFGGWNTNSANTGIRYNADSAYTVTVDVLLYAMWVATPLTDIRDGQIYKTIIIDSKIWMAENLNYANGWCYENAESNCVKYGRLYDWNRARTACPTGWHLPTRGEWGALAKTIGGIGTYGADGMAGMALKSTSGWGHNGSGNGTDEFGFSALPGGYRSDGSFYNVGDRGYWWTATENASGNAYDRRMYYNYDNLFESNDVKNFAFSLRCVADD